MSDIVERLRGNWAHLSPDDAEEAADEIERLRGEIERMGAWEEKIWLASTKARNDALEEAAKLIDEGFDRPGIDKKQDRCAHNKFGWDDCEQCAADAIRALKDKN